MASPKSDIEVAVEAVRRAAAACEAVRSAEVGPGTLEKDDRSPVTVADFASQAVVARVLDRHRPGDPLVGEETADALRGADAGDLRRRIAERAGQALGEESLDPETVLDWIDLGGAEAGGDRFWTIDPIDGTKGFLRGDQYAIALALVEGGKVTLGVLGCPALDLKGTAGVLLVAARGKGTELRNLEPEADDRPDSHPLRVSTVADVARARFCESVESAHSDQSASARIAKRLGITADPVRVDSQCKYAMVAHGDASIYLRLPTRPGYVEKIWDHAAGAICVREAGGRVTDIDGRPLDFSGGRGLAANRGIIATNGRIHDEVVAAVQAEMSDPGAS